MRILSLKPCFSAVIQSTYGWSTYICIVDNDRRIWFDYDDEYLMRVTDANTLSELNALIDHEVTVPRYGLQKDSK